MDRSRLFARSRLEPQSAILTSSLNNLSYIDSRANIQLLQSPPIQAFPKHDQIYNNVLNNDYRGHSPIPSRGSGRGIFKGYNFPNGVASPMISPTYKPSLTMNNLRYNKEDSLNLQDGSPGFKSSTTTLVGQMKPIDRRFQTDSGEPQNKKDLSLTRGLEIDCYSPNVNDFKRFNADKTAEKASKSSLFYNI